jgi:hypothetical protein
MCEIWFGILINKLILVLFSFAKFTFFFLLWKFEILFDGWRRLVLIISSRPVKCENISSVKTMFEFQSPQTTALIVWIRSLGAFIGSSFTDIHRPV